MKYGGREWYGNRRWIANRASELRRIRRQTREIGESVREAVIRRLRNEPVKHAGKGFGAEWLWFGLKLAH